MVVAGLRRHAALDQVARRLEVHHGDHGLEQRGLHPLPLARPLALGERGQHADRRVDASRESATAIPARTGPWPGKPVTAMRPPIPWAIWSKPGRVR